VVQLTLDELALAVLPWRRPLAELRLTGLSWPRLTLAGLTLAGLTLAGLTLAHLGEAGLTLALLTWALLLRPATGLGTLHLSRSALIATLEIGRLGRADRVGGLSCVRR
jgi:hypothetical protein